MFLRTFLLFAVIFIPSAVVWCDEETVNNVIADCVQFFEKFKANEDIYTRKRVRPAHEPDLYFPQFNDTKRIAYDKEVRQRVIECIADAVLKGFIDADELYENVNFLEEVSKCKDGQRHPECDPDCPYRTIDGTCNNLDNPLWGAGLHRQTRFLPAFYVGAAGFRRSQCGDKELPHPRDISRHYMPEVKYAIQTLTSSHVMYFGQFIAHDLLDGATTFVGDKHLECCYNPGGSTNHTQCAPIFMKPDDYFYVHHKFMCFNFIRNAPFDSCELGTRINMNEVTTFLDLSQVYGSTDKLAHDLRTLDGTGQLKIQEHEKGGDLMPTDGDVELWRCGKTEKIHPSRSVEIPVVDAPRLHVEEEEDFNRDYSGCFKGGDRRVNQHTTLMSYHTVFVREHNRIAKELQILNPHWDDEKLYQEARKILIAQYQVIVYGQFLPHMLREHMATYDLEIKKDCTRTEYDPTVDPSIPTEFSTAAYRLHTMVDRKIGLIGEDGTPESSFVANLFSDSSHLYHGKMDSLLEKLGTWSYMLYDNYIINDLSRFLYKERKGHYGFDMTAVNIQRGRDNGLPPYADVVEYFHGVKINEFEDLVAFITLDKILKLKRVYCHVRDIDLFVGLNSETKVPPMVISPTTAMIIGETFKRLKFGDRFYFENPDHFTDDQLESLKKATLARIMCDNTKIPVLPHNMMEFPNILNPNQPCPLLPKVDLELWKE